MGRLHLVAAGMSAALCVGVCMLWVRSYWRVDEIGRPSWHRCDGITSSRGHLVLARRLDGPSREAASWRSWRLVSPYPPADDGDGIADMQIIPLTWGTEPGGVLGFKTYQEDTSVSCGITIISTIKIFPPAERWRVVAVPYWSLAVACAAVPAAGSRLFVRRLRRLRRGRQGLCPACAYDLRATPGRCPECGAVPTTGAA